MKPWEPAKFEPADASAVQAVYKGQATEAQQQRCMDFILNRLTDYLSPSFRPEGSGRVDAFIEGKRFVGLQLRELIRADVRSIVERQEAAEGKK